MVMARCQKHSVLPKTAGDTHAPEIFHHFRRIRPSPEFPPLGVELHENRLRVVIAVMGEVAPPMIAFAYGPGQAAAILAKFLERSQGYRLRIQDENLTLLWLLRIIRMCAV